MIKADLIIRQPAATDARAPRRLVLHPWMLVGAAVLACLCAVLLVFPESGGAAQSSPVTQSTALTVTSATVRRKVWPVTLDSSGPIAPWQEAIVGARVAGLSLIDVLVDVGDGVKRGQVIARFDAAPLRADESQLNATLAQAKASAVQAEANRQRALQLKDSGGISEQDVLQFVTQAATTKAQVDVIGAQWVAKQLQLRYATVVAPDDGVISARAATVGAVAQSGTELFRLIRQRRLEWRGELTARQLGQIKRDQSITLVLPNGLLAKARVRQTAPSIDAQSRLGTVFADVEPDGPAVAGMYATGRVALAQSPALTVPAASVVVRDGRNYMMRLRVEGSTSTVRLQAVELGRREGDEVEIVKGLADGDVVAVQGAGFLNEGDLVKVVPAPVPTTASPINLAQRPKP